MSERKRRQLFAERFIALSAIIPGLKVSAQIFASLYSIILLLNTSKYNISMDNVSNFLPVIQGRRTTNREIKIKE